VAVIAKHVVVLLHEEVGGITHGGLCTWTAGLAELVQKPGSVDSKFTAAAAVSSFWPGFSLLDRLFSGLLMIFWPCQEDEGDCPELECPFPFNLVTPSQHNTQAMEEIFCATSRSSVVNELTRQGTWNSLVLCVQTSTANTRLLSWQAVS
jgi:hypothetical protein